MALKEKIENDLVKALKSKDEFTVGALRFLLASIQNREIEKRGREQSGNLTDEELEDVLRKEAKKRKESFDIYAKSGRNDLSEKERKELNIIKTYLPPAMTDEELEGIIERAIASMKPAGPKDFGRLMGIVMKEAKGIDAAKVSGLIKEKIGGSP